MSTAHIVILVAAAAFVLVAVLAFGLSRTARKGERAYPSQPKGLAHDHDVEAAARAPQPDAEVLPFRQRDER